MSEKNNNAAVPATELQGNIGTFQLVMCVVALSAPLMTVAGIGPQMLKYGGNSAPPIFLMVTIILVLFSIGFVKMGMHMQNPGGFYAYITAGLGKKVGLGAAFVAAIGYPLIGFIGSCYFPLVFTDWVHNQLGGPDIPWWIVSLIYLAVIVFLDMRGVDLSVKVMSVVMAIECIIVIAMDIGCFLHDPGAMSGGSAISFPRLWDSEAQVGLSMLFIFGTFMGFESTVIYREEVREPNKTIPRATLIAVCFIGIFYGISTWAFISYYGANNVQEVAAGNMDFMMQDTMVLLFGRIVLDVISVFIMISMFASSLSVVNVAGRYLYSLGKDGCLPRALGRAHRKYHSPYIGIIAVGATYAIVVICMAIFRLDPVEIFPRVNGIGSFTIMLVMLIASLAIFMYFKKNPIGDAGNAWNTKIAPILGLIGIAMMTYFALINYGELTGGSFGLTVFGLTATVVIFLGGIVYAAYLEKHNPETYSRIGRERI